MKKVYYLLALMAGLLSYAFVLVLLAPLALYYFLREPRLCLATVKRDWSEFKHDVWRMLHEKR